MTEACYTAQAMTKQLVLNGLENWPFKPTRMGNTRTMPSFYWKGHSTRTPKPIQPNNPGKGMEKLLDADDNRLTLVMSADAITARSVIKEAK